MRTLNLLLAVFLVFSNITYSQTEGFYNKYYTSILGGGWEQDYLRLGPVNTNLWHHYTNGNTDRDHDWKKHSKLRIGTLFVQEPYYYKLHFENKYINLI